ncbi:hypothetical protein IKW72_01975 [bacterium]|nr:hypothetical protein [bacterium]
MRSSLGLTFVFAFAFALCLCAAENEQPKDMGEMTIVTTGVVDAGAVEPAGTAETAETELTAEQLKEAQKLETIKGYVWAGIHLTMPYADVTNVMSKALEFEPPEYPYKAKAYMVAAVDSMSGSTNRNILTARRFYFDQDDKLLAMEHIFSGCTVDQKNYLLNMYSRKYSMIPLQAKDHSFFKIADGLYVVVEFVESQTKMNIYGWHTPNEYSVRAVYYLEKEFISLINRTGMAILPPEVAHP